MKKHLALSFAPVLLAGCAQSPEAPNSSQQAVMVVTRDGAGHPVANAHCELANNLGAWKVTPPASVLVDRSLSPLSVLCTGGDHSGVTLVSPSIHTLACKSGEECGYPALITVEMRSATAADTPEATGRAGKLKVSGHGAPPKDDSLGSAQRKLMAMRAAKADAYRALAEQLYGVRVSGTTTVGDMVIRSDLYRVYVDAYVFGARVVSSLTHPDGIHEVEMELALTDDFRRRMTQPGGPGCEVPGGVGPGCAYASHGFYHVQ
ncbi:MAG: LPP20 family lipoprotein [Pseudomonadota bacterium]